MLKQFKKVLGMCHVPVMCVVYHKVKKKNASQED